MELMGGLSRSTCIPAGRTVRAAHLVELVIDIARLILHIGFDVKDRLHKILPC